MFRSMLFVPADSQRKLEKSLGVAADALVLDLEDSVLPANKPLARQLMREHLGKVDDRSRYWVRVNDLASGELTADLAAVVPACPAGILLPKILGPEDVAITGHYLDMLEDEHGVARGSIQIAVIVTETPAAVLRMGALVEQAHPRIAALLWGAEDLSAALGAADPRLPDGRWKPLYEQARNTVLLAAGALGVPAIDTVFVDLRNLEALADDCRRSRSDSFAGRVAVHPDQVPVINAGYAPQPEEVALARRIVEALSDGAGAVAIDGKMYDIPHLKAARRLLEALQ